MHLLTIPRWDGLEAESGATQRFSRQAGAIPSIANHVALGSDSVFHEILLTVRRRMFSSSLIYSQRGVCV